MSGSTIVSWALVAYRALAARGPCADAVFVEAGLDPARLWQPNERYPYEQMQRLWHVAVEVTGNEDFGIEVARQLQPTSLHALGYAWLASATLREAWERVARYARLLNDELQIDVCPSRGGAWLLMSRRANLPLPHRVAQDASTMTCVQLSRQLRGQCLRPLRARLGYERPASIEALSEALGAPLEFGCNQWGFEVAASHLDAPLPTANPTLAKASEEIVREQLALRELQSYAQRVKTKLFEHLASGDFSVSRIACELCMSERTLLRHLKLEGTSYAQLLDEVRRDAATQHLADPRNSLAEISFLLGFSEASNFSRAFKRWIGVSPSEYRREMTVR